MKLLEKYATSIEECRGILKMQPEDHGTRGLLAYSLFRTRHDHEALTETETILKADPLYIDSLYLKGAIKLMQGQFLEGYSLMECRAKRSHASEYGLREYVTPLWNGSPTKDTLLVWAAEGFGDTIQQLRYLHKVKFRCPNVVLEVQPELVRLCQSSFPDIRVVPYVKNVIPDHDLNCCILSLPFIFKTTIETIPSTVPYLHTNVEVRKPPTNVGLCWSANKMGPDDLRAVPVPFIASFAFKHDFFCLHKESGFKDFAETAAAIKHLDLVITTDTSIAHLAGALGKETWVLIPEPPDHRWLRDISHSPWYPTARLFRQVEMDSWTLVFENIDKALIKWKAERPSEPLVVTKPYREKFQISFLKTDIIIGKSINYYGVWSPGETNIFSQFVKGGDHIIEAGSNIGAHSIVLADLVGKEGKFLGFEPQRGLHELLRKNLSPFPWAETFQAALTDKEGGTCKMLDTDYSQLANYGGLTPNTLSGYDVPLHTVDFFEPERCDLLKIDVEGMECKVLRGARETIKKFKPVIYVEYTKDDDLFDLLYEFGYEYIYFHNPPLYEEEEGVFNLFPGIGSENILATNHPVEAKYLERITLQIKPDYRPVLEKLNSASYQTLTDLYPEMLQGLCLEFGVYQGRSLNILARFAREKALPDGTVFGFDSFEGLPEDWIEGFPKGHFACDIPPVEENVILVKGLFQETLPYFIKLEQFKGIPVSFIHIDSDLYSSAKFVLDTLYPYMVPGTLICFDEIINSDQFIEHELKAWTEFVCEKNISWECVCKGEPGTGLAIVRIR